MKKIPIIGNFYKIKNEDFNPDRDLQEVIKIEDSRIFMAHGPSYPNAEIFWDNFEDLDIEIVRGNARTQEIMGYQIDETKTVLNLPKLEEARSIIGKCRDHNHNIRKALFLIIEQIEDIANSK